MTDEASGEVSGLLKDEASDEVSGLLPSGEVGEGDTQEWWKHLIC